MRLRLFPLPRGKGQEPLRGGWAAAQLAPGEAVSPLQRGPAGLEVSPQWRDASSEGQEYNLKELGLPLAI